MCSLRLLERQFKLDDLKLPVALQTPRSVEHLLAASIHGDINWWANSAVWQIEDET